MGQIYRLSSIILATVICIVAVILTSGRIFMVNISGFEERLNASSERMGSRYEGMSGDWNLLNPVIELEKLHFPVGIAHDVYFEIDALESLLRNQLVAHRLHIRHVEIFFEQPTAMQGTEYQIADLLGNALLLHSDEIHIETLGIAIQTQSKSHYYVGSFTSKDLGNYQAFRSDLTSLTCDGCIVHVAVDLERGKYPIAEHLGRVDIDVRDFPIHPEILGVSQLPEAALSVKFHGEKKEEHFDGNGQAELLFGDDEQNGLSSSILVSSFGGLTTVELRETTFQTPTESVVHDPIFIREFANERVVWMDELEISALASLLVNITMEESAVARWITAMDPQGKLHQPMLLMEADALAINARLTNASINAYKEMPGIKVNEVEISGDLRFPQLSLTDGVVDLHIASHFDDSWHVENVRGSVQFHFAGDRFAMYVEKVDGNFDPLLVSSTLGINRTLGAKDFSYTNINRSASGVFQIQGDIDLVPKQVPVGAKDWITGQIISGDLSNLNLLHHFVQDDDGLSKENLIQLSFDFEEGIVEYLPDWPLLLDASGSVYIGPDNMQVDLESGVVWDAELEQGVAQLPFDEDTFQVSFEVETEPNQLIQFVLATELKEYFTAVQNTWVGEGSVRLDALLELSYEGNTDQNDINLNFNLDRVQLGDTALNLYFDDLSGLIKYRSPYVMEGRDISGTMFGNPLHLDISTGVLNRGDRDGIEHLIRFDLEGRAEDSDIYEFLEIENLPYTRGGAAFEARYLVNAEGYRPPELVLTSDLQGVDVVLGEPLKKHTSTLRPTEVRMVFHEQITELDFTSGALQGWVDLEDDKITRGSIGIGATTNGRQPEISELVLTGTLGEWYYDRGAIEESNVTGLVLDDFRLHKLHLQDTDLTDAILDGYFRGDEWSFSVSSEEVVGDVEQLKDQPMRVHIAELNWPYTSPNDALDGTFDPLDPTIVEWLSPMHLTVDHVRLLDSEGQSEDYGKWDMKIHPSQEGIVITELTGEVRGLHIETTSDAFWDTEQDVSQFEVAVTGTDLGEVLSSWGYDTQMISERFELRGNLFWSGSPLAYEMQNISGAFRATSRDGRFLEIEPNPALRIVSLLNISTIADRLQLDFGDVLLKGYAYEDISLGAIADNGLLRLNDPLVIKGRSTELRMLGSINMRNEELNLEVIATLPANKALPWYSAAISLANPALGVGLLITTTTFEGPIRQMTSGRYKVQGTLTDPKVEFIGMFDSSFSDSSELQLPIVFDEPSAQDVNGETKVGDESSTNVSADESAESMPSNPSEQPQE